MLRTILGVIAVLVALFSVLLVCVAVGDLMEGNPEHGTGTVVGLLVFFGGISVVSGEVARRCLGSGARRAREQAERERIVLALAAESGGRLSAAEVAMKTEMTVDQSRAALETLVGQREASVMVTEDGAELFEFKGLLSAEGKAEAKDMLDA